MVQDKSFWRSTVMHHHDHCLILISFSVSQDCRMLLHLLVDQKQSTLWTPSPGRTGIRIKVCYDSPQRPQVTLFQMLVFMDTWGPTSVPTKAPLHVATLTVQRELPDYIQHLGSLPYLFTKNETMAPLHVAKLTVQRELPKYEIIFSIQGLYPLYQE